MFVIYLWLQKAETNEEIQKVLLHEKSSMIYDAGFKILMTHIKLEHIQEIIRAIIVFTTVLPIKGELDQLAKGLNLYDILSLIKSNGEIMKPLFIHGNKRITAEKICYLKYSPTNSSQERKTAEYWNQFLEDLEHGLIGILIVLYSRHLTTNKLQV